MDILRIPLFSVPEEGVEVAAEIPVAELRPSDGESFPGETVSFQGRLMPVEDTFLFRGTAHGSLVHSCDRCLAETRNTFEIDVLWTFEEGPPLRPFDDVASANADQDVNLDGTSPQRFQGGEIDLAPPLWEELQLAAPEKHLCSETCLGLCPRCGANRNNADCGCAPDGTASDEKNNGLAGLAKLFPELCKEKPKE